MNDIQAIIAEERQGLLIKELKKQKRCLDLIANFVDGYAEGWFFAVGECFKDELDIKFTDRVEPVLVDGKVQYVEYVDKKGDIKKKKKTRKVKRWTQGPFYAFAEGHIIFDTPNAYRPWAEALQYIGLICNIVRATPNDLDASGYLVHGHVTFTLQEPNIDKSELVTIGQYDVSQNQFVEYLRTGKLNSTEQLSGQQSLF